jgi:Asp-tRNA(Asn)/Glu-tRNA(Gln) amidotransferase B subunit
MSFFEFDADTDPTIVRIIKENGYISITDPDAVLTFCVDAMEQLPKMVAQYKKGNTKVLGALIGYVMKRTNFGVEPPSMIEEMFKELLAQ